MATYVTSDPHLSSEGSNTLNRPFGSAKEMSREIIEQYNSRAGRHDRLIVVGDWSYKEAAYWRTQLRCKQVILIMGNHDNWNRSLNAFGKFRQNVYQSYDGKLCGHPTFFLHYACCVWPKSHYGSFHCYGHTHDMRESTFDALFPGRRSMDVSVDSAQRLLGKYTCFHEQEIYDMLISRPGWDDVQWYRQMRGEYKFKDHGPEESDE